MHDVWLATIDGYVCESVKHGFWLVPAYCGGYLFSLVVVLPRSTLNRQYRINIILILTTKQMVVRPNYEQMAVQNNSHIVLSSFIVTRLHTMARVINIVDRHIILLRHKLIITPF